VGYGWNAAPWGSFWCRRTAARGARECGSRSNSATRFGGSRGPDAEFQPAAQAIAQQCGRDVELTDAVPGPAQPVDPSCVDLVRRVPQTGYSAREIVSGAGHDAVTWRARSNAMISPARMACAKRGREHRAGGSEAGLSVLFEAVVARANRSPLKR